MAKSRKFLGHVLARNGWIWAFTLPTVVLIAMVMIYPVYFLVGASLKSYNLLNPAASGFVGLSNFGKIFDNAAFINSLINTIVFVAGALLMQVFVGTLIGISISGESRGSGLVRGLLLIPMMFTPVVSAHMWKMLLDPAFGLVNYFLNLLGISTINWLGSPNTALFTIMLIDSWKWTPFVIITVAAGVVSLPQEPFEAARIDGANELQKIRYILIPMISRLILICAILRIMGLMKVFDIVYVGTGGGPGDSTEVVNLLIYQQALSHFNIGMASAMSVILMLTFAVICWVYLKLTHVLQ